VCSHASVTEELALYCSASACFTSGPSTYRTGDGSIWPCDRVLPSWCRPEIHRRELRGFGSHTGSAWGGAYRYPSLLFFPIELRYSRNNEQNSSLCPGLTGTASTSCPSRKFREYTSGNMLNWRDAYACSLKIRFLLSDCETYLLHLLTTRKTGHTRSR